jgi:hypothetical protein
MTLSIFIAKLTSSFGGAKAGLSQRPAGEQRHAVVLMALGRRIGPRPWRLSRSRVGERGDCSGSTPVVFRSSSHGSSVMS